ncbi:hypothetical protein WN51_00916 [Melipona quadrifasciata]|uniref:Uncharacterized protein n=1 Tax=Melipona quadrifasciata TaxID=166423 RepID=A0A0M8ZVM6_9HYME|nr:hypothetical protein WN51_00916 [Melipona quadrifasciata]
MPRYGLLPSTLTNWSIIREQAKVCAVKLRASEIKCYTLNVKARNIDVSYNTQCYNTSCKCASYFSKIRTSNLLAAFFAHVYTLCDSDDERRMHDCASSVFKRRKNDSTSRRDRIGHISNATCYEISIIFMPTPEQPERFEDDTSPKRDILSIKASTDKQFKIGENEFVTRIVLRESILHKVLITIKEALVETIIDFLHCPQLRAMQLQSEPKNDFPRIVFARCWCKYVNNNCKTAYLKLFRRKPPPSSPFKLIFVEEVSKSIFELGIDSQLIRRVAKAQN